MTILVILLSLLLLCTHRHANVHATMNLGPFKERHVLEMQRGIETNHPETKNLTENLFIALAYPKQSIYREVVEGTDDAPTYRIPTPLSVVPFLPEYNLVMFGADLAAKLKRSRKTPLLWAIYNGRISFAKWLLLRPDIATFYPILTLNYETALMYAIRMQEWNFVEFVLSDRLNLSPSLLNINHKNMDKQTPLMYALHYEASADIVKKIIAKGASVTDVDTWGNTIRDYNAKRVNWFRPFFRLFHLDLMKVNESKNERNG